MMNHDNPLGYDPCDQDSFPYQADDPPFDRRRLRFEDVDPRFVDPLFDPTTEADDYRPVDMALKLFAKITQGLLHPAYEYRDIPLPQLFAACLTQARIWEDG